MKSPHPASNSFPASDPRPKENSDMQSSSDADTSMTATPTPPPNSSGSTEDTTGTLSQCERPSARDYRNRAERAEAECKELREGLEQALRLLALIADKIPDKHLTNGS